VLGPRIQQGNMFVSMYRFQSTCILKWLQIMRRKFLVNILIFLIRRMLM
jgi:hypothetical protein